MNDLAEQVDRMRTQGQSGLIALEWANQTGRELSVTASKSVATELMSAAAFEESHVDLNATLGALLAPQPLLRRCDFDFLFLGPILHVAGLVGQLQRTLRMDAVARIGSFSTDRTKILNGLGNDGDRLENAHEGSEGYIARSIPAERWGRRQALL
jgi:hypothetical protein